ncbi:hypothetical protein BJX63DRAFT_428005 [Aspergillus granulosus]|uniref:Uncharacterized protein n=1 Tax=Aspergillus granulosus TaxID=176169 RepID=A0ABR4HYW7_9EURO
MRDRKNIKCVIIGDSGIGKTSLLVTYTTKVFPGNGVPKLLEFSKADLTAANQEYALQLWDTTWEQGYTRLCSLWYPETDVFLLCFSINSWDSLDRVEERWVPEIVHMCPGVAWVLVGLKKDLRDDLDAVRDLKARKMGPVKYGDGANLAKILGCTYVECSSRDGEGVDEVFEEALGAALLPRKQAKKSRCQIL